MTNYYFQSIAVVVLVLFTNQDTTAILQKRAKFRIRIVRTMAPPPTLCVGWSKAHTPIPRKTKTRVSAEYAIVSYAILSTFLDPLEMFGIHRGPFA